MSGLVAVKMMQTAFSPLHMPPAQPGRYALQCWGGFAKPAKSLYGVFLPDIRLMGSPRLG
jgi:hypothetical protein